MSFGTRGSFPLCASSDEGRATSSLIAGREGPEFRSGKPVSIWESAGWVLNHASAAWALESGSGLPPKPSSRKLMPPLRGQT